MMKQGVWMLAAIPAVVAGWTDWHTRRIPNWLVAPFLVIGIVASTWLHGWHGLGFSFEGLGLGLLLYGILFWMGGMGAGDVKLAAAIGAWIGPGQLFIAMIVTAMAGGIMVLGWALFGGFLKDLFKGAGDHMKRKMPYAPAIAIGTLFSFFAH